jgi:hypothetical protein
VKEGDLVAATQGRGYWILDDLSTLRQLDLAKPAGTLQLFEPRPTPRVRSGRSEKPRGAGTNPPPGVLFSYVLPEGLAKDARSSSRSSRPMARRCASTHASQLRAASRRSSRSTSSTTRASSHPEKGLNRFAWDLRVPSAEKFEGMVLWNNRLAGPRALPGTYRAVLKVGEEQRETSFEVVPDPRSKVSAEDLRAQYDFLLAARDELTRTHRAIRRVREVRAQVEGVQKRLPRNRTPQARWRAARADQGTRRGALPDEERERAGPAQLPESA